MSVRSYVILLAACALLFCSACGGSGGSGDSTPPVTLDSVSLGPTNPRVPTGFQLQLVLTGHYSDGTSGNLSSEAVWSSSFPGVASVGDTPGSKGLIDAHVLGTTTITVGHSDFILTTDLDVIAAIVTQIEVTPGTVGLPIGASASLIATAYYDGGFSVGITNQAAWSSSDTAVATMGGPKGTVTAQGEGECEIQASWGGFTDRAEITVLAITTFEAGLSLTAGATVPSIAQGAGGEAFAVWAHKDAATPSLWFRYYDAAGGWEAATQVPDASASIYAPGIAANAAGEVLVAWSSNNRLYASFRDPATGWESRRTIDSIGGGGSPFAQDLHLTLFANGDGLAVWRDDSGTQVMGSVYSAAGNSWSAPTLLGDAGSSTHDVVLASNGTDRAAVLWQHYDGGVAWTLSVSEYDSVGGWAASLEMYSSGLYHQPALAMDATGNAVATWIDFSPFPAAYLYASIFELGVGWYAAEKVSEEDVPREPVAAMESLDNLSVLWRHAALGGTAISSSIYEDGTGWLDRESIMSIMNGTAQLLAPLVTVDGQQSAFWFVDTSTGDRIFQSSNYSDVDGWGAIEALDLMGFGGLVRETSFSLSADGESVFVGWDEEQGQTEDMYVFRLDLGE